MFHSYAMQWLLNCQKLNHQFNATIFCFTLNCKNLSGHLEKYLRFWPQSPWEGGLDEMIFRSPLQPKPFYDFVIHSIFLRTCISLCTFNTKVPFRSTQRQSTIKWCLHPAKTGPRVLPKIVTRERKLLKNTSWKDPRGQKPWIPTRDISKSPNVVWFFPPTKLSFYKAIPEPTSCNTRGHLLDSKHNFIHDRCTFHLKPVFYLGSIRSFSFGHFFPQN